MTRKEWIAQRRRGIGASESAAIFDAHPYISKYSLWESKVSEPKAEDDEAEDRRADGLLMEPRIAAKYAKKSGRMVEEFTGGLAVHPEHAVLIASPDRIATFEDGRRGPVELKWWDRYRVDDDIPAYGQIQLMHQFAVLGSDIGSIAVLGSFRSFSYVDMERNQAFIDLLIEKVEEFWDRYVKTGIPPETDGSAATSEAIRRLHPKDNGQVIFLPAAAESWTKALADVKERKKAIEAEESALENSLRAAIGDATMGQLPDGTGFTLRTTTRKAFTVAPTEFRALRRTTKLLGK